MKFSLFSPASVSAATIAPGIGVGATLHYWGLALRFAAALVAREQFLPNVVQEERMWFARWVPVIAGSDRVRFDRLAKVMPPACRAAGETRPHPSAAKVLRDFIAFAVDRIVRGAKLEKPRKHFDSIHDRWLHALRSPTGEMGGTESDAVQLAAAGARVASADYGSAARPAASVRPARRTRRGRPQADVARPLPAPAHDDPSLHIPAADVWAGKAHVVRTDPKPILLAGLGQAANLSPEIASSLKKAAPTSFAITTGGAHRFLKETAWLLEQAGFGVLLPAWWTGHATRQKLEVKAKVKSPPMSGGGGLSLEDLIEFRWSAAIGDEELTLAEAAQLAKMKEPLVRLRGKWVQVNAGDIQAAIELLQKKAAKITARDAMKLALGIAPEGLELPTRGASAIGWVKDFLDGLTNAAFTELEPPAGLRATLRPYQVRGYSWLAFLRAGDWARAWPTTWDWARRCRRWR